MVASETQPPVKRQSQPVSAAGRSGAGRGTQPGTQPQAQPLAGAPAQPPPPVKPQMQSQGVQAIKEYTDRALSPIVAITGNPQGRTAMQRVGKFLMKSKIPLMCVVGGVALTKTIENGVTKTVNDVMDFTKNTANGISNGVKEIGNGFVRSYGAIKNAFTGNTNAKAKPGEASANTQARKFQNTQIAKNLE